MGKKDTLGMGSNINSALPFRRFITIIDQPFLRLLIKHFFGLLITLFGVIHQTFWGYFSNSLGLLITLFGDIYQTFGELFINLFEIIYQTF